MIFYSVSARTWAEDWFVQPSSFSDQEMAWFSLGLVRDRSPVRDVANLWIPESRRRTDRFRRNHKISSNYLFFVCAPSLSPFGVFGTTRCIFWQPAEWETMIARGRTRKEDGGDERAAPHLASLAENFAVWMVLGSGLGRDKKNFFFFVVACLKFPKLGWNLVADGNLGFLFPRSFLGYFDDRE